MTCEPFKPITRQMATEILEVSLTTLDALVATGALPAPKPLGGSRRVYWLPEVFYTYLRQILGADSETISGAQATDPMRQHETAPPGLKRGQPRTRPRVSAKSATRPRLSTRIERLND
jgi:hypothetical protein